MIDEFNKRLLEAGGSVPDIPQAQKKLSHLTRPTTAKSRATMSDAKSGMAILSEHYENAPTR